MSEVKVELESTGELDEEQSLSAALSLRVAKLEQMLGTGGNSAGGKMVANSPGADNLLKSRLEKGLGSR